MYIRNEAIEEEHLDWEGKDKHTPKPLFAPEIKDQSALLEEYKELDHKLDKKRKMMTIFEENSKLFSLIGLLILPYILGFVLTYLLFYFYGGMSLGGFIDVKKDYLLFQLWSIGAYLFVTVWVFWAFFRNLTSER